VVAGDPGEVSRGVDVIGAARVAAFDLGDEIRPGAQEGPRPRIAGRQLGDLGPVLAGQQHGIAGLAVVGGDGHARPVPVRGDQPGHGLRSDERLIGEGDHRRTRVGAGQSLEGDAERGTHAGPPLLVVDGLRPADLDRGGARDDQDRVGAAGPEEFRAAFGERLTAQFDERLGPAEPGPFPRGEQHSRDRSLHGPSVRARPGAPSRRSGGGCGPRCR
jgi:hypothetical protein